MMPRCPICGVESEHMDLHESTLHTESKQEYREMADRAQHGLDPVPASSSEKQEQSWVPVRRDAIEWLARQDRNTVDRAYVAMEAIAMAQIALNEHPEGFVPSAIPASAIKVLQYVSRGRDYVDIEPYPDAAAREALGEIRAVDRTSDLPDVSTRKESK